jgi:hypothetical protein
MLVAISLFVSLFQSTIRSVSRAAKGTNCQVLLQNDLSRDSTWACLDAEVVKLCTGSAYEAEARTESSVVRINT